jgi:hypothetical protein
MTPDDFLRLHAPALVLPVKARRSGEPEEIAMFTFHKGLIAAAVSVCLVTAQLSSAVACGPYGGPPPSAEEIAASWAEVRVREVLPGVLVRASDAVVDGDRATAEVRVTRTKRSRKLEVWVRHDEEGGAHVESMKSVRAFGSEHRQSTTTDVAAADRAVRAALAKANMGEWADVVGFESRGNATMVEVELSKVHTVRLGLVRGKDGVWKTASLALPAAFKKSV